MDLHLGTLFHCLADPGPGPGNPTAWEFIPQGALAVEAGRVVARGPATVLTARYPDARRHDWGDDLIVPGFVDTHIHAAQVDVIASYGAQLLDWLERYTFPEEACFADPAHAAAATAFFFDQLAAHGTTSACIFPTVHEGAAEAVFAEAARRRLRIVCGKVGMDRLCPEALRDGPDRGRAATERLIARWHGHDRLRYILTPRFAATSTPEQLAWMGQLRREVPGLAVQSHVAENRAEVAWVQELYPEARSYLDVYERHGLLGPGCIYAHGIYLDDADRARLAATGTALAFCPSSNEFLGSGLFDLTRAREAGVTVGLGSDVGAGPAYSLLRTLASAYGVLQLQGQSLSPWRGFYLATLAGAQALGLEGQIGNFLPGKEADFVILDPAATPVLARRTSRARERAGGDLAAAAGEILFALMLLGDDRAVRATHILGETIYRRP
ncbi:guanine deaminase [Oryzomicrobium terrae]|uniref:Guanine deaminase n=1 Tax=Oryzomicrobium terrae TaxID=1735038 RepID=A0A5C1E7D8_9RHOO|nr:guanine deaminase [Oryzomicrobium terrae]QEL64851.1 guanine deaminase [Oryzomicrobium terrae]